MERIVRKTKTSTYAGIALWTFAVGCSSQASNPMSSAPVIPTDAASDCIQSGAAACDATITAMCTRFTQCCATLTTCESWATDMARCKAHWVEGGLNCASPTYSDKTVCASLTAECQGDIPLIACTDAANGTANWPASCGVFWGQFR
jgi:hypothetical protein